MVSHVSTIVVHSDYLAGCLAFNAFDVAIDHFVHGYGIVTGEIGLVFFDGILYQPR
jgi:hypothetical protein